jgi:hypothetical protein
MPCLRQYSIRGHVRKGVEVGLLAIYSLD